MKMYAVFFMLILFLSLIGCGQKTTTTQTMDCVDTDHGGAGPDVPDYLEGLKTKGTVTSDTLLDLGATAGSYKNVFVPFTSGTDSCQPPLEGNSDGVLVEYLCMKASDASGESNRSYAASEQFTCSEVLGEGYICQDGACVLAK